MINALTDVDMTGCITVLITFLKSEVPFRIFLDLFEIASNRKDVKKNSKIAEIK